MSVREAAKQASKDIPAPRSGALHYTAGSGAVTAAQREAATEGAAAGWKLRQREAALNVIATGNAMGGAADFTMPLDFWPLDKETGERVPMDARAVLAEAEASAVARRAAQPEARAILARLRTVAAERPLTDKEQTARAGALDVLTARTLVGRYVLADTSRMSGADAAKLAAYARRCAERMAHGRERLSETEAEDVEADALAAILKRGHGTFPRWDALAKEDLSEAASAGVRLDALRGQWRGFAYLEARAAIRRRHERLKHEAPADWTPTEDGEEATPEQRAALAAEVLGAALTDALDTGSVTHGVYALSVTAQTPLSTPERDALALALSGRTREQIARARGASVAAVQKNGTRGRAALADRTPDRKAAQAWAREAARRMRNLTRASDRTEAETAMAAPLAPYHGARLSWAPRMAPCDGGATGHIPAPIVGAGTHRTNVVQWQGGKRKRTAPLASAPLAPITLGALAPVEAPRKGGAASVLAYLARVERMLALAPGSIERKSTRTGAPLNLNGAVIVPDCKLQAERERLAEGRARGAQAAAWTAYQHAQRATYRAQQRKRGAHLGAAPVLIHA